MCGRIWLQMSSSFYKGIVSGSLSSPRGLGRMTLSISATCFAPKKKKAGSKSESSGVTATSRQEGTDHLFNVYASYPDHVIKDDDAEYPQWVNQIGKKKIHSYGELEMKFIYGKVRTLIVREL